MKYNTPRQRKKIYEHLIHEIDAGELFYICVRLVCLCRFSYGGDGLDLKRDFPELHEVRPKTPCAHWWYPTMEGFMKLRRKRILRAIELCNKQIAK